MANAEAFRALLGNEALKQTLCGFADRRAFPHALLFCGPEGSGKSTAARLAAQSVACRSDGPVPCQTCEACRKIREGISPDVITVRPLKDRRTLGVETVRSILQTAFLKPNDLDVRIYLIPEAERMTVQAQNALLKLFEEPPENVYFFLLTAEPVALLPTVRSRAPELRTELFSDRELTRLLTENSKKAAALYTSDPVAFRRVLNASRGSYGLALSRIERPDKAIRQRFEAAETVLSALIGGDKSAFLLALLNESADRTAASELFALLQTALRDMVAVRRCGEVPELLFFPDADMAADRAAALPVRSLLGLCEQISLISEEIAVSNVNLRTAVTEAALRLWKQK